MGLRFSIITVMHSVRDPRIVSRLQGLGGHTLCPKRLTSTHVWSRRLLPRRARERESRVEEDEGSGRAGGVPERGRILRERRKKRKRESRGGGVNKCDHVE